MRILIVISVSLLITSPGIGQDSRVEKSPELAHYKSVLSAYGIEPDANGANDFLCRLFPDTNSGREIAALIKQLSSAKYLAREEAEMQLVARGAQTLGMLKKAAKNGDTETRLRASRSVQSISKQHPQIIRAAINVLKLDAPTKLEADVRLTTLFKMIEEYNEFDFRSELTAAVKWIAGPENRDHVVNGLQHSSKHVRVACIESLRKCIDDGELQQFVYLIKDKNAEVALAAIRAIGSVAPDDAGKRLVELLRSDSTETCRVAVFVLRTVSGEYFQFHSSDSRLQRESAVSKWEQWLSNNTPLGKELFEKLDNYNFAPPRGFLVSVSNKSLKEYDLDGKKVWDHAISAYDSQFHAADRILVTERSRNRIRLIDRNGKTIRSVENAVSPSDAELLENGNILIAHGAGMVTEHDGSGNKIREFNGFNSPFDVDRLDNGNTVVADSGNNRIVILDPRGKVVWEKKELAFPNNVFVLPDRRILYTTYTSGSVVMLGPNGDQLWEKKIDGATLFDVYSAAGQIYVADGSNSRIWVLDINGNDIRKVDIPTAFCDVHFITK